MYFNLKNKTKLNLYKSSLNWPYCYREYFDIANILQKYKYEVPCISILIICIEIDLAYFEVIFMTDDKLTGSPPLPLCQYVSLVYTIKHT